MEEIIHHPSGNLCLLHLETDDLDGLTDETGEPSGYSFINMEPRNLEVRTRSFNDWRMFACRCVSRLHVVVDPVDWRLGQSLR